MQIKKRSIFNKEIVRFFHLFGILVEVFIFGVVFLIFGEPKFIYEYYKELSLLVESPLCMAISIYVCHFLTWLIEIDVNRGKVILNYKGKGTDFWIWTALIFHIIARAMVLFPYFFGIHMDVLTISVFTFVLVRLLLLISMIFCVRKQLKMTEGYESLEFWCMTLNTNTE